MLAWGPEVPSLPSLRKRKKSFLHAQGGRVALARKDTVSRRIQTEIFPRPLPSLLYVKICHLRSPPAPSWLPHWLHNAFFFADASSV